MIWKQIQKLSSNKRFFNHQRLLSKGNKILLAFFVLSVLFSTIPLPGNNPLPQAQAQGSTTPRGVNCDEFDPTYPNTFAARVYVAKTDTSGGKSADRSYTEKQGPQNGPPTQVLRIDEPLQIYFEMSLPDRFASCGEYFSRGLKLYYGIYGNDRERERTAVLNYDTGAKKFYVYITNSDWSNLETTSLNTYLYVCKTTGCSFSDWNFNDHVEYINVLVSSTKTGEATTTPPSSPLLGDGSEGQDAGGVKKAETIKFKFEDGLRDKYRVLKNEASPFNVFEFGKNGVPAIKLNWADQDNILTQTTQLTIPVKNYNFLSNPYFKNVVVGANYGDVSITDVGCQSGYFTEDCSNIVFTGSNGASSSEKQTLPNSFNPKINNTAWSSKVSKSTSSNGEALGSVEFRAIPIIWAARGTVANEWFSYVYGSKDVKFTLEVYEKEEDIKKACEADGLDSSICNDPQKMRYEVGKIIDTTTGTDSKSADPPGQTNLFGFIARVVSYIVLLITSMIYWIFSTILVPVIVSLLNVRPWTDVFVDFIYPGWVIIRNISNIAFIAALLYMGLRILFQADDASKSRPFIIRLILMALLVNFSLVIGQGLVAVADTVQSQFLPAENKVIETLGAKLMVDPIITFRGGGLNDSANNFDTNATASNIPKAFVLLALAVAAFFAFVAIAAFILIRLVALWVLYMLSPLAYVAYIVPKTQKYAEQWWQEFIKYATMVPVLAFFLNIAALMATTFSVRTGDTISLQTDSERLLQGVSDSLVSYVITVVGHFIVLVFIYIGMQYALKSGTVGAAQVVGAAKKGFDNLITKPGKWLGTKAPGVAKDYLADKAATKAEKANRPGLAKAITATAKPWETTKAAKKAWLDEPLKERKDREARRIGDIPYLTRSGKLKDPLKSIRDTNKDKIHEDNKNFLADLVKKSAQKGDRDMAGAAMYRLASNGDFDEILKGVGQITDKTYTKNAAGLSQAMEDMQSRRLLDESQKLAMLRHFDTQAGKDKSKRHYSGNVDYEDGEFRTKQLDGSAPGGFAEDSKKQWTEGQVKGRLSMGMVEDTKQSGLDSMVVEQGDELDFTETQIGVFASRNVQQLNNAKEGEKFRATSNYRQLAKAYRDNGGYDRVLQRMRQYRQDHGLTGSEWSDTELEKKAAAIHSTLFNLPETASMQAARQARGGGQNAPTGNNQPIPGFDPNRRRQQGIDGGGGDATASVEVNETVVNRNYQVDGSASAGVNNISGRAAQYQGLTDTGNLRRGGYVNLDQQNVGGQQGGDVKQKEVEPFAKRAARMKKEKTQKRDTGITANRMKARKAKQKTTAVEKQSEQQKAEDRASKAVKGNQDFMKESEATKAKNTKANSPSQRATEEAVKGNEAFLNKSESTSTSKSKQKRPAGSQSSEAGNTSKKSTGSEKTPIGFASSSGGGSSDKSTGATGAGETANKPANNSDT